MNGKNEVRGIRRIRATKEIETQKNALTPSDRLDMVFCSIPCPNVCCIFFALDGNENGLSNYSNVNRFFHTYRIHKFDWNRGHVHANDVLHHAML